MKISLTTVVSASVLFVFYIRYLEKKTVFVPSRTMDATPQDMGLSFEDIYFKTEDDITLNGWFVKAGSSSPTLIYFHGNAGNIADRLEKIRLFHDLGLNVFIIDYRGYGKSQGYPTEKGMYKDALGGYDYLITRADIARDKIIAYGASLGGAAAIDLAGHRELAGLIVDSSFTNAADMGKLIFPFAPSFLIQTKLDSTTKVKTIRVPKLFMHSKEDTVVPFELGRKLYETAADPKEFAVINGDHNDGHLADTFGRTVAAFVGRFK